MAGEGGLFAGTPSRVWTIPPGTDFLRALAETLAKETGLGAAPDALADAIIYVPNRRSARVLARPCSMREAARRSCRRISARSAILKPTRHLLPMPRAPACRRPCLPPGASAR